MLKVLVYRMFVMSRNVFYGLFIGVQMALQGLWFRGLQRVISVYRRVWGLLTALIFLLRDFRVWSNIAGFNWAWEYHTLILFS